MQEIFFYGLFMDQDVLAQKGLKPSNPRKGYVAGWGLRIGNRATLVRADAEKAYGMVMQLSDEEAAVLYSEESVSDYIPEHVVVTLTSGEQLTATCYNLPEHLRSGRNAAYAQALAHVAIKCGLPEGYADAIRRLGSESDQSK